MSAAIPPWLTGYLVGRDRARQESADAVFGSLSEREQRLVREAAVMGYVLGGLPCRERVPPDRNIVRQVINGAQSQSDIFPLLGSESGEQ